MALNPALRKMVSQAAAKNKGGGGNAIKPKEGRNTYRLLAPKFEDAPWVGENGQFWADQGVHWIKADPNGKPIAVVGDCDIVYQQPSAINTAIEMAIANAIDEDSKKLYSEWKARKTVLFNVIDRDSDNEEILELTPTTASKVWDLMTLYDDAGQDITDPVNGADIIITRTGKGLNTNYDVAIAPSIPGKPFKPVTKEQLARAKDLHEFIATNYFRGEEQKALNAIASIAGIALPKLAGPSGVRTPTAALTSSSAAVEDAKVDDSVAKAAAAAAATAAAAAAQQAALKASAPAEDPLAAKRAEILKRQQEAEAAAAELAELEALEAAAASKAAAVETPAPATGGLSTLPASEQDAILAELDNLV